MRQEPTLKTEEPDHRPAARRTGGIDRRTLLATGTATVLGAGLAGCMGGGNRDGNDQGPSPRQLIEQDDSSYYSLFVKGGTGYRTMTPFDVERKNERWMTQPTSDGGIRCRVENAGSGTAGFELSIGPLGDIDTITIRSRTERNAKVFYALYLDKDGDGEFYKWEQVTEDRQRFVEYGNDKEAVEAAPAGDPITIDEDAQLTFTGGKATTLGELQQGQFQGIGGSTATALYAGVLGNSSDNRELVIEDVDVQTSS